MQNGLGENFATRCIPLSTLLECKTCKGNRVRFGQVQKEFGHDYRSSFGVQVRIKLIIGVSVQWSVSNWVSAMLYIVNSIVFACLNIKETVMNKLHAIVSSGVALLPVPGWIDASQFG